MFGVFSRMDNPFLEIRVTNKIRFGEILVAFIRKIIHCLLLCVMIACFYPIKNKNFFSIIEFSKIQGLKSCVRRKTVISGVAI